MQKIKVFCILFFAISLFIAVQGCAKKIESARSSSTIEGKDVVGVPGKQDMGAAGRKEDKGPLGREKKEAIGEENVGSGLSNTEVAGDKDNSKPVEVSPQERTGSMLPERDKDQIHKEPPVAGREEAVAERPVVDNRPEKEGMATKPHDILDKEGKREDTESDSRGLPMITRKDKDETAPGKESQEAKVNPELSSETNKRLELKNGELPSGMMEVDKEVPLAPENEAAVAREKLGTDFKSGEGGLPTEMMDGDEKKLLQAPDKETLVAKRELGPALEAIRRGREDSGLKDIFFDFDKWVIKGDLITILEENARYIISSPGLRIVIEGHADERGTNEYNLALGERRAKSAMNFLVDIGVEPERISFISYGEERPFCNNHEEPCWSLNRRGHFLVIDK